MYKVDKNIITFSCYQGEDVTYPFRSKISDVEYNRLTDYKLDVWASAEVYDFTPEFNFVATIDSQDPYLGYISISGDQTIDTRESQAHIRVYGIHKVTNERKMLFSALMQIKA